MQPLSMPSRIFSLSLRKIILFRLDYEDALLLSSSAPVSCERRFNQSLMRSKNKIIAALIGSFGVAVVGRSVGRVQGVRSDTVTLKNWNDRNLESWWFFPHRPRRTRCKKFSQIVNPIQSGVTEYWQSHQIQNITFLVSNRRLNDCLVVVGRKLSCSVWLKGRSKFAETGACSPEVEHGLAN